MKKRYLLISEIGLGSYSIVYISYDLKNKNYCAVKIFDYDSIIEGKLENKLYNKCDHENIINTTDNFIIDFEHKNILYKYYTLVFPLKNNNIRFINKKIFYCWIKNIIEAVKYLHIEMKICHTDIKPENFVLNNIPKDHLSIMNDYNKYIYLYENLKLSNIEKTHSNILNIIYYSLSEESQSDSSSYFSNSSENSNYSNSSTTSNSFNSYTSSNSSNSYTSSNSSNSSTTSNSSNNSEESKKYKKNISKKSTCKNDFRLIFIDLGSSQKISKLRQLKYKYRLVQTRYYRSPEIILGLPYTEKIDIWSIGCSLYELYTSKILFNPRHSEMYKTDNHHLFIISKLCGKIPSKMIKNSPKKDLLFSIDESIKYSSLFPEFVFNIENEIKDKKIVKIIKACITIDPDLRPSITELFNIANII